MILLCLWMLSNRATMWKGLRVYQWLAGSSDTVTGLMLVLVPEWTLHMMRVQNVPSSLEMISFVGVFVLGVGAGYLTTTRIPRTQAEAASWVRVWLLTGISRALVAIYVGWQLALGRLEPAWASVMVTDVVLASVQFLGLSRGWLSPLTLGQENAIR